MSKSHLSRASSHRFGSFRQRGRPGPAAPKNLYGATASQRSVPATDFQPLEGTMDRQPSQDEIATMHGRLAVEVDLLRRSAKWARRFARNLSSYPQRPELRHALRVF